MVKQEEVIHSSKVRGLCISPRKVGGLSLVRSKIVETNFKNDEHSDRVNEKASGNQPPHGAESTNPASTALQGVDIISPLC